MKYNYDEDGVAFYFFFLTVLAVYLAVGTWYWIVVPRLGASKEAGPTGRTQQLTFTCV